MQSVAVGLEASISLRNRLCNSRGSAPLVSYCVLLHLFLPLLIIEENKQPEDEGKMQPCVEFCPEISCYVAIVTSSLPWQYRTLKRARVHLFWIHLFSWRTVKRDVRLEEPPVEVTQEQRRVSNILRWKRSTQLETPGQSWRDPV